MRTITQSKHLEARTRDILRRITRALPDWPTDRLESLALQMAQLEIRYDGRSALPFPARDRRA